MIEGNSLSPTLVKSAGDRALTKATLFCSVGEQRAKNGKLFLLQWLHNTYERSAKYRH